MSPPDSIKTYSTISVELTASDFRNLKDFGSLGDFPRFTHLVLSELPNEREVDSFRSTRKIQISQVFETCEI
jgi:hypothetical protein